MKRCFKCKQLKALADFYAHPEMADGHLGKCKECAKADVNENRRKNLLHFADYENVRSKTVRRRLQLLAYARARRFKYPEKTRAHSTVARAIRSGRLMRQACEVCGSLYVEAHHDDYRKPLDVRWLCFRHHREYHGQVVTVAI